MRPPLELVVSVLLENMGKQLAVMPPGQERLMLFGLHSLLGTVLREADRAAAMRFEEITELAQLFNDARAICPAALQSQLQEAVAVADSAIGDLRVSALEKKLDQLRETLIALHTWLESSQHERAPALLSACWDFLVRANRKRAVNILPW